MEAAGFDSADIRVIATIFYADNGLIDACNPTLLQDVFNLLINLFDRAFLTTNKSKTKVMVFLPGMLATQHGIYHSHLLAGAEMCQPVGEHKTLWVRHVPAKGVW